MRTARTAYLLALGLALSACAGTADRPGRASSEPAAPTTGISTLTPIPMPSMGPPPGEIVADLRQSSRDAALGRFQVWIGNGMDYDLDPRAITYDDPRFRAPIPGERLRVNPAGSERGYPLALPPRPDCDAPRHEGSGTHGTVTMRDARHGTVTVQVEDEADVVQRYVATRCFEIDVARVATLSFADEVPVDHEGEGSVGQLVLVATPSGRPGAGVLTVDTVGGTPLLTPAGESVWHPDLTVRSTGAPQRVGLPMVPARCDDHVFMESGGATAFRLRLHLNGEPGELVVRMSSAGAAAAIGFARDSCGLG